MKTKVSFSLFHPTVLPDGCVIMRKPLRDGVPVLIDPVERMWIEHYTDLYQQGILDLEDKKFNCHVER